MIRMIVVFIILSLALSFCQDANSYLERPSYYSGAEPAPLWNPWNVAGTLLFLYADSGIVTSAIGDTVISWTSVDKYHNVFTAASPTDRPKFVSDPTDGKFVQFDGIDDLLVSSLSITYPSSYQFFIVIKDYSGVGSTIFQSAPGTATVKHMYQLTNNNLFHFTDGTIGTTALNACTTGVADVYRVDIGSTTQIYRNGRLHHTYLGQAATSSSGTQAIGKIFSGKIKLIAIYDHILPPDTLAMFQSWITTNITSAGTPDVSSPSLPATFIAIWNSGTGSLDVIMTGKDCDVCSLKVYTSETGYNLDVLRDQVEICTVSSYSNSFTDATWVDGTTIYVSGVFQDPSGNMVIAQDTAKVPDITPPDSASVFGVMSNNPEEITTSVSGWPSDGADWVIRYRTDGVYPQSRNDGTLWASGDNLSRGNADKTAPIAAGTYHFALFQADTAGNWQNSSQCNKKTVTVQPSGGGGGGGPTPLFAWNMEKGDTANVYPAGSDSIAEMTSAATQVISDPANAHEGTRFLQSSGSGARFHCSTTTEDIFLTDKGYISLWVKYPDAAAVPDQIFFYVRTASSPFLSIKTNASDLVEARIRDGLGTDVTLTSASPLLPGNWYNVIFRYRTVSPDTIELAIPGVDTVLNTTANISQWSSLPTEVWIGIFGAVADTVWVDDYKYYHLSNLSGGGGGGGPNPPNAPTVTATAIAPGQVEITWSGVDDSLQVWAQQGSYPSRGQGVNVLNSNFISGTDTVEADPGGVWYYSAFNDSANLGNWSAAGQDTANVTELDPQTPVGFTATAWGALKDSVRIQYSGGAATVLVINSGNTLFTSSKAVVDTAFAFIGDGTETFIARRDSAGALFTFSASVSDTAVFPSTGLTLSSNHPRTFFLLGDLGGIASYINTYESSFYQNWITNVVEPEIANDPDLKGRPQLIADCYNIAFVALMRSQGHLGSYTYGYTVPQYVQAAIDHGLALAGKIINDPLWENRTATDLRSSNAGYLYTSLGAVYDWLHDSLTVSEKDSIEKGAVAIWTNRVNTGSVDAREFQNGNGIGAAFSFAVAVPFWGTDNTAPMADTLAMLKDTIDYVFGERTIRISEYFFGGTAYHGEGSDYNGVTYGSNLFLYDAMGPATGHNFYSEYGYLRYWPKFMYFYAEPYHMASNRGGLKMVFTRNGDVSVTPTNELTIWRIFHQMTAQIKQSYPTLAGEYKRILDGLTIYDFSGAENQVRNSYPRYYGLWILLFGTKDITPAASLSWAKQQRFGNMVIALSALEDTMATKVTFNCPEWAYMLHHHHDSGHLTVTTHGGPILVEYGCNKNGYDIAKTADAHHGYSHNGPTIKIPIDNSSTESSFKLTAGATTDPENQEGGQNDYGERHQLFLTDTVVAVTYDFTRSRKTSHISFGRRTMHYYRDMWNDGVNEEYVVVFDTVKAASGYVDSTITVNLHFFNKPVLTNGKTIPQSEPYLYEATSDSGRQFSVSNTSFGANAKAYLTLLGSRQLGYRLYGDNTSNWSRDENNGLRWDGIGTWDEFSGWFTGRWRLAIDQQGSSGTYSLPWVLQLTSATGGASAVTPNYSVNSTAGVVHIPGRIVAVQSAANQASSVNFSFSDVSSCFIHVGSLSSGTASVTKDGGAYVTLSVRNGGITFTGTGGSYNVTVSP